MTEPLEMTGTVLVLAPLGRDAEVACTTVSGAGLRCRQAHSACELSRENLDEVSALLLTEELLSDSAIAFLAGMLDAQAVWSSLPVIVLVDPERRRTDGTPRARFEAFGTRPGVIVLQRPMSVTSFLSVMRSAVMARQKQFELRDQLHARERAEARTRMLAEEMKHRVKNAFSLANSIASQTFRDAETIDEALDAFSRRVTSMARAQDLISANGQDSVDLAMLFEQALEPYRVASRRQFDVGGPQVRISGRMATALSMALHELATNAVKYGALSTPSGQVTIRWTLTETPSGGSSLTIEWCERGGPPVAPPRRRGFGSMLVERALGYDLGGSAHLAFDPEGVVCTIEAVIDEDGEPEAA